MVVRKCVPSQVLCIASIDKRLKNILVHHVAQDEYGHGGFEYENDPEADPRQLSGPNARVHIRGLKVKTGPTLNRQEYG